MTTALVANSIPAVSSRAHRPTLSVVVLTYNEAHRLRPCLESVAWADEIVIVDGFSTDATLAIAREFTPCVFQSDRLGPSNPGGFSDQRNYALEQATGDWVFFLDADERVTPELQAEITARLLSDRDEGCVVYQMRRREHFFGVPTRYTHGEAWQTRLLRRGQTRYDGRLVHETPIYDGARGDLESYLLHFSKDTIAQYVTTLNRYTSLEASELMRTNAPLPRSPWRGMAWAFCYRYLHMRSYREGAFGLLMSLMFAFYQYLTWAKQWEGCKNAGRIPGETQPGAITAGVSATLGALWRGVGRIKQSVRNMGRTGSKENAQT